MQARITNSLLPKVAPSERPYEIRDTNLKGFLLRVQPSGAMSYYVEYAWGKRVRLGRAETLSPAKAREEAKAVLSDVYAGKDPAAARRAARAHTLESFVDEVYAPWADANLRTANATVARLKRSFPELQSMFIGDITPWLVEKWRAARLKSGTKATTVNRDLDDLKSTMNKATQWGFLETNPITSVRRSRVDHAPRVRYLTEEEENRLRSALRDRDARIRNERASANAWRRQREYSELPILDNCPFADHLEPMVLVSLNTGLRQGELFDLDWYDLDFSSSSLTVRGSNAKSGHTRHVPLNAEALRVLTGWRAGALNPAGIVFPGRGGKRFNNVRRAWLGVLNSAGIERFRWHDLRHTFASNLVMNGVDLNTARELLGHASYQMTLRYAHLAPEHKVAAVAKLRRPGPTELTGNRAELLSSNSA